MHNAYTLAHHNRAYRVCIPRRVRVHLDTYDTRSRYPRRDYNRY
jgi:hypothetical protein